MVNGRGNQSVSGDAAADVLPSYARGGGDVPARARVDLLDHAVNETRRGRPYTGDQGRGPAYSSQFLGVSGGTLAQARVTCLKAAQTS